jgi:TolB protein
VRRVGVVLAVAIVLGAGPAAAHSPPGHVAFTQVRGGRSAIWTMNAFGTGLRRVATGAFPAWSLTGTRIAFVRDGAVWVMGADGSGQRRLVRGAEPSWSPDGMRLALVRPSPRASRAIWIVDADGSNLHRVSGGPDDVAPAWSPNGSTIAFERRRGGSSSIWTIGPDAKYPRLLLPKAGEPAWSQDARRLAFTSTRARFGGREVYVAEADGSHVRRVTRTRADEGSPSWSTDGIWIATASNRSGRYAIWLVSLQPPEVIRATVDRWSDVAPAWGL